MLCETPSVPLSNEWNRLVSKEPMEFEKSPVGVQDLRKITDHFPGNLSNIPQIHKRRNRSHPKSPWTLPSFADEAPPPPPESQCTACFLEFQRVFQGTESRVGCNQSDWNCFVALMWCDIVRLAFCMHVHSGYGTSGKQSDICRFLRHRVLGSIHQFTVYTYLAVC